MTIRHHVPYVTGKELGYVTEVFQNGTFAGNGPFTKRVHALLEARYGVPKVLLTHSCTAALEMAALLLDTGPGDEVILPSYTFVSTGSAFLRTGARLVLAEIEPESMTLDLADVARRITERTRAIVPVHYGGLAADMKGLRDLVRGTRIALVEDAAQGLDARCDGAWLGTIGRFGAISFHETKNLHCGLGGALFVNEAELADRAEDVWERGTDRTKLFRGLVDKYSWVELGSSFYPSELQAAFLLAQLEAVDVNAAERKLLHAAYAPRLQALAAAGHLDPLRTAWSCETNFHAAVIRTRTVEACDGLRAHLLAAGIHAYIGYVPLHESRMGKRLGYVHDDLPVTSAHAGRVLRLPLHNAMSQADVARVCDEMERYFGR